MSLNNANTIPRDLSLTPVLGDAPSENRRLLSVLEKRLTQGDDIGWRRWCSLVPAERSSHLGR